MEKKLKIKCVVCVICILIGVSMIIIALKLNGISELQKSYMSGFGNSFTVVSLVLLIKNIIAISNPNNLRKREIELTDERNIKIATNSMAITFRICIILQAILSMVLAIMDNELGMYLGLLVGIQLIVYIITNVIISKKYKNKIIKSRK